MFDKNFNFLDAAWDQLDDSYSQSTNIAIKDPFDYLMQEITIKEEGFAYVFISNESPMLVDIYFDDVKMTHTKTNIIQYNEYYLLACRLPPAGHGKIRKITFCITQALS